MHLVCDGAGKPVHIHLTVENTSEIKQARQCLRPYIQKDTIVIADRGYDADHLPQWLDELGATACIPPRKNRKIQYTYHTDRYKTRNIIT
jgi:transposase